MMYSYPVVITMRHSNVYEERSLGIYADDVEARPALRPAQPGPVARALRGALTQFHGVGAAAADATTESRISFLSHQVRGQRKQPPPRHSFWSIST